MFTMTLLYRQPARAAGNTIRVSSRALIVAKTFTFVYNKIGELQK